MAHQVVEEPSEFEPQQSELSIPGQKLTYPTFPVVEKDWGTLRRMVMRLSNPLSWARELGWCAITLASACLLGLVGWLPPYQQLPETAQVRYAGVAYGLVIGTIACVVIAVLAFGMHYSV